MRLGVNGQAMQWVLGGIGTFVTIVSVTFGFATNTLKGTVENIQSRQNNQEEVIRKLTEIEAQNATLIKVHDEHIKQILNAQNKLNASFPKP